MLESVKKCVESQRLTVLVTHWWEYFRDERPDSAMLAILHATAEWVAGNPRVRMISFDEPDPRARGAGAMMVKPGGRAYRVPALAGLVLPMEARELLLASRAKLRLTG